MIGRSGVGRRRVLVIDGEPQVRDLLRFHLERNGFDCITPDDGPEALRIAISEAVDLIVLDVALPFVDGMTICREVRREGPNRDVPILILTARGDETDKLLALQSGADDYLTKPFGILEFLARTSALLRRLRVVTGGVAGGVTGGVSRARQLTPRPAAAPPVSTMGVSIDPSRRRVVRDGQVVALTPQEFSLLYVLASNPGTVFSREELLAVVHHHEVVAAARAVDTLVKRLRRKIEDDPARPRRVISVRGAGYKFGDR